VFDEEGQLPVNGQRPDAVIIIQDENEPARAGSDVVDQGREQHLPWRRFGTLQHGFNAPADAPIHALQGRQEVGQETGRVAVGLIKGEPSESPRRVFARLEVLQPAGDQGRLAIAGWRRDQRQPGAQPQSLVQPLHQPRARNQVRTQRRDQEFCGQQWRRQSQSSPEQPTTDGKGHGPSNRPGQPGCPPRHSLMPDDRRIACRQHPFYGVRFVRSKL